MFDASECDDDDYVRMGLMWPSQTHDAVDEELYLDDFSLERAALRPRASTPPLVSSPASDPPGPGVATTERPSTR